MLFSDSKFKEFIEAFMRMSKASEPLSLDEGRKLSAQFFLPSDTIYEPVKKVENRIVRGRDGYPIPIRLFTPNLPFPLPVLIYFHRGGWVFGSIEEADPLCRKLANHLHCLVVSVGYRLAPEHPFPKPLEDGYDVVQWVAQHADSLGGDSRRIIVSGESAGGNLAAAAALMARDQKGPLLAAQLLIYPALTCHLQDASYRNSVDQYFLTKKAMKWFWKMYLQQIEDHDNQYASPLLASDLSSLPPAVILTAEYDPLHDEGEKYAKKLHQQGVPVATHCFPKAIHGCLDLPIYDEADKIRWIKEIRHLLNKINIKI